LNKGLDVAIDPQGRIQVMQKYREAAGLVKDVILIGMTDYFEIWDLDRWTHQERGATGELEGLYEKLAAKGV